MDVLKQTINNLNTDIDDVPNCISAKDITNAIKILKATDNLLNYLRDNVWYQDTELMKKSLKCLILDD